MPKYNSNLFEKLVEKIGSKSGVYSAIRRKEKIFRAVKPEILIYLVAEDYGFKTSKYEKNDSILKQVNELLIGNPPNNELPKRKTQIKKSVSNKEMDPFVVSLSKFNVHPDLSKDCKIKKPYSKEINHSILILEEFIRDKLGVDDKFYGRGLIEEAKKKGVFKRKNTGEEQGLYFLYSSSMLWLKNSGGHKRRSSGKEDCFKIILFVDYLIRLFEELCNKTLKN